MKRRVVVTGLGALTPIGNDATTGWENAKKGVNGIAPITHFDTSEQKVKLAGEVKKLEVTDYIDKKAAKRMDRFSQLGVIAAKEAFKDSGIAIEKINADRMGVIVSSGIGGLGTIESEHIKAMDKGYDRVSPFYVPMIITNMAAGNIAIELGAKGMCSCVVTACAGGTNSIGDAFRHIRDGYGDIMVAGGAEASITRLGVGGFTSAKTLNDTTDVNRASIPFDKERNGFVMGEGAGILVLEELNHAKARGARIYGEIVGYGASCDAYHMTAPDPEGGGAKKAIEYALQDANIAPEQVDYINAHGTSTSLNDKGETLAVKKAFGDHAYKLSMSSTKSMTGHLLGATGAVEALFSIKALEDGFIPPTINYQTPDPDCDLDITPNKGRKAELKYAISNSLGFGGHNATLVFKKWEGQ